MHTRGHGVSRVYGVVDVFNAVAGGGQVITKCALFHNALILVKLTYAIRAGIDAILASDALLFVNQHNVVVGVAI
jgi:hypothetical protein